MKTLFKYDDPRALLDDYGYTLTEEERDALAGLLDFEAIALYVIDGETVLTVDTISGDVLASEPLPTFYSNTVAYAHS